jgi:phosphopantetheinyl transferase
MPLLFSETPKANLIWGSWHITETETELRSITKLSLADEEYLKTITHPEKRLQTLSCRALLHQLCKVYNVPYKGVVKDKETGKPYLTDSDWHTSFSHCRSMASAILHKESPVGIDVELLQDKLITVQSKFMDDEEIAWANNDMIRVGAAWSAKEAMYKYVSHKGLTLKQIKLHVLHEAPNELSLRAVAKWNEGLKEMLVNTRRYRDHVMSYTV